MQFEPQQSERILNTDPREQPGQPPYGGQKIYPQRQHGNRWLTWLLSPVVIFILLFTCWALLHSPILRSHHMLSIRTFTLSGHATLALVGGNGDIHIHSAHTNTVTVQQTNHTYGLDNQSAQPTYNQKGNTLTINNSDSQGWLGEHFTEFDITVPISIDLRATTGSGNIDVTDINGTLDTQAASGDVTLSNINGSTITAGAKSGNIQANDITGQAVTFTTSSGNIASDKLSAGQVTCTADSGNIIINQGNLSGQTQLKTSSGNLDLASSLNPAGNYTLQAESGDVTVTLPTDSSFSLSTKTDSGNINNDFASSNVGQNIHAPLTISTSSGNIALHKS